MRKDARTACRLLLGGDDAEMFAGFRGWLIAQGEAAVRAALRNVDGVMAHAKHPVARARAVIFATWQPLEAHDIYGRPQHAPQDISDREAWSPDWTAPEPTVAELRARFPRLTAELPDERVAGPDGVWRLSEHGRRRAALDLLDRAKAAADAPGKIEALDRAAALWADNEEILAVRGRLHTELGNFDAALVDLDAALARRPDAWPVIWDRAKARLARGDREGALADARQAAHRVDEARDWLIAQAPVAAKRVRHPKFGDGAVVSEDATGSEPKLVIDFAGGRKTIASRFVIAIDD
jgi:tetratricopeptide (TPR) repeat protein